MRWFRYWCIRFQHRWGCARFWVYGPARTRRVCGVCGRRQVLQSDVGHGSWVDHIYPMDADPTKDPTVVYRDGVRTTLGAEAFLVRCFAEAFGKNAERTLRHSVPPRDQFGRLPLWYEMIPYWER